VIGIRREPPDTTSRGSQPEVSKYVSSEGVTVET